MGFSQLSLDTFIKLAIAGSFYLDLVNSFLVSERLKKNYIGSLTKERNYVLKRLQYTAVCVKNCCSAK